MSNIAGISRKSAYGTPILITGSETGVPLLQTSPDAIGREADLQYLIDEHPECLPLGDIDFVFRNAISVCTELPTPSGPMDNLFMTADGNLVFIEVKLWRNHDSVRKVVSQVLDYASGLFAMDYPAFEAAVLRATFGHQDRRPRKRPERLCDLFSGPEAYAEEDFVNAVSRNLHNGRALILVVGDGIRPEAERLAEFIDVNVSRHFTFGLIELKYFDLPDGGGKIVCPRTIAYSQIIPRIVVEIDDKRTSVRTQRELLQAPTAATGPKTVVPENVTAEQFYESLGKVKPDLPSTIRSWLSELEPSHIYPDYRRTLILRHDMPNGDALTLASISPNAQFWSPWSASAIPSNVHNAYVEKLAAAFGAEVRFDAAGNARMIAINGHAPRLDQIDVKLETLIPIFDSYIKEAAAHME